MAEQQRRPGRLFPALAVVGGVALAAFEVRLLWDGAGGQAWFWLVVAVLMIALGVFGLLDNPDGHEPPRRR
jgi:hypothetical protein